MELHGCWPRKAHLNATAATEQNAYKCLSPDLYAASLLPQGVCSLVVATRRGSIASRDLRAKSPGAQAERSELLPPGPAAVRGMEQLRFMAVLSDVAAVGQGWLQINEPGTALRLKTLPCSWSDLALACLIHVGIKRLMPNEDSGLGIGAKHEEAVRLHGACRPDEAMPRPKRNPARSLHQGIDLLAAHQARLEPQPGLYS